MSILLCALLAAGIPIRNPFWPIGYEGEREAITSAAKVVVKASEPVTDETATSVTAEAMESASDTASARQWVAARKTLTFGGRVRAMTEDGALKTSVIINGKAYGDGDLISVNHANRRFTWRVQGLTDGNTLKLERVKSRRQQSDEQSDHKLSKGKLQ